jgi:hypothetical protein
VAGLARVRRLVNDYTKELGGIATKIAAIIGLVFLVSSHVRCSPSCAGEPSIAESIDVSPGSTWRDYLQEIGAKNATGDLAAPGVLVHPNLVFHRYAGKRVPVKWTLLTPDGTQVATPGYKNQLAYDVKPASCTQPMSQPIWVQKPPPGRYRIQLLVYASAGDVVLHTSKPSRVFVVH